MQDIVQHSALELLPFFELTPDLVCIARKDGYFQQVNPAVIQKLGYTEEELYTHPISSFIFPDDKALTQQHRNDLINGKPLVNFQNRYVTKSGAIIWLDWTSVFLPGKELVFAIAKDVTRRKETELEIEEKYNRFKGLANHFKGSIERDRKYLSVSLHEELAQLLAVLKMDIDWVKAKNQELPDAVSKRLEHAGAVTELLIKTIQRISFTISPGMLNDLGLVETLRWHCNEFAMIGSVNCSFNGSLDDELISKEVQLDIFRICQEALHNVLYHANALNASVTVSETDTEICFEIIDDGKGFALNEVQESNGLTVMKERAASIHANLTITSKLHAGTSIKLCLPKSSS